MMLPSNLSSEIKNLQNYKKNRQDAFMCAVEERLSKSVRSYYDSLSKSTYYLKYNSKAQSKTLLREVNKADV